MGRPPLKIDFAELRRLYLDEQRSLADVAKRLATNPETIRVKLRQAGIPVRPSNYPGMRSRKIG